VIDPEMIFRESGAEILRLWAAMVDYPEDQRKSAILYALHIVGLGAWSRPGDALGMSILQIMVIAVVCLLATAPDGLVLPQRLGDWLAIIYMAVFAGALAMLGQTWAQAHLPPTRSAIIMTMEPVFAATFAVLLGGESLSGRMAVGPSAGRGKSERLPVSIEPIPPSIFSV